MPLPPAQTRTDGGEAGVPVVEGISVPVKPPAGVALPPQIPPAAPPAPAATKPPDWHATLARLVPPRAPDRMGWAADIGGAITALHIAPSRENLCAAIAVIEQESSFQADPVVPGLSRIAWREIEKRRKGYGIPKLILDAALARRSPDGRSYKTRIDGLKTEKQMSDLFEDMISELPHGKTLLGGYNPVRTGGPMQVSVEFAEAHARVRPYPFPRKGRNVRDEVFSRRGGVYFGIADLLDYPAPYSQPVYRFADYNAGRYSSRNAAFQAALSTLGGRRLDLDGDLLRYRDGVPSGEDSATLQAILPLAGRLRMNRAAIMADIGQEKAASFGQTVLYQRVFGLAEQKARARLPRELLPRIRLKSPKIRRQLTTEWFARRVETRYRTCLAR